MWIEFLWKTSYKFFHFSFWGKVWEILKKLVEKNMLILQAFSRFSTYVFPYYCYYYLKYLFLYLYFLFLGKKGFCYAFYL